MLRFSCKSTTNGTGRLALDRLGRLRRVADEQAAKGRAGVNDQAIQSTIARSGHPLGEAFLTWTLALPTADLDRSILDLRKAFKDSPAYAASMDQVPWAPVYEKEEAPVMETATAAEQVTRRSRSRPGA
jgi:hypothetical protein